jgi:hypothetical protein
LWVLGLAVAVAACGGGGSDDDDGSGNPPAPPPPSSTLVQSTVSGKLVAPDNITPISNALVYVEASEIVASGREQPSDAPPPASQCGAAPNPAWSYTCTGADGSFSFTLRIPSNNAKLVATKGAFRAETQLPAAAATLTIGSLALPVTGTGAVRMAVVTGLFDRIQDVLAKLGYGEVDAGRLRPGTERFDLFDGDGSLPDATYSDASALFADVDGNGRADIFNYAIVFLNCGLDETAAEDPTRLQILRDYVQGGGRLYVSDLAYDFVEQTFPAYVDFEGSTGTAAGVAETAGEAELGTEGITSQATLDPALSSWLGGVTCAGGSCLGTNGTVTIEGFLGGWAVMVGPHPSAPSAVRVWAQGPVVFGAQTAAVNRPLTVSFAVGSGRVTYTSYHTEPEFAGSNEFLPQERILQFLVFEL